MERLEEATEIDAPMERCFDLARSVEVHIRENTHWGEAALAIGGITSGLVGMGGRVIWQARHFGVRQRLTSDITAMDPPRYFQDTMVNGAFRSMQHDHHFRRLENGRTAMRDVLCFEAPAPVLGRVVEILVLRRYMAALLHERMAVIKLVAESDDWHLYLT